jgi:hypothetical protein
LFAAPALAALPQAERENNVYQRARFKREAVMRAQYPDSFPAAPQTVVNVYAPTFIGPGYGYHVSPAYGRPAWPPAW